MTNNQSNSDSQLNHVDVSFYQFLGSAWKNHENTKLNPEALEMLLVKTDGIPETETSDLENKNTKFEDSQFIQKSNEKSSTNERKIALKNALDDGNYTHVVKLTYPTFWYNAEMTTEIASEAIKCYVPQIYSFSCLLWNSFWIILLTPIQSILNIVAIPVEYCLELFCEKAYRTSQITFKQGYQETRFWLGRGRGNTYVKAMYQRCLYIVSYFRIHKFYVLDQFIKSSFTIRRGLQAMLPLSITYLIVQRTINAPQTVYSKGLEKTSKTLKTQTRTAILKLSVLENLEGVLDPKKEYFRDSQGILFTRTKGLKTEFVEGKYTDVEKEIVDNFTHPNEFLAVFQQDKTTLNDSFSHEEEIGRYEWSSADELAQMPPREKKEEGEEDETEPPPFTPEPVYKRLQIKDKKLLTKYKKRLRSTKQRTNKQFTQRGKQLSDQYMPLAPRLGQFTQKDLLSKCFEKLKYKPIRKITDMQAAPLVNSVDSNVPWAKDINLVHFLHESANEATFLEQLYKDVELKNNRVTFSPFGIHYHTGKTTTVPLKPFTSQETKLFHYSLSDTSLEVFNQRPDAFSIIEDHPYRSVLHERTARQLQNVYETKSSYFDSDEDNWELLEINDNDENQLDAEDLDNDDNLDNEDDLDNGSNLDDGDESDNEDDLDNDNLAEDSLNSFENHILTSDFEDTNNENFSENNDFANGTLTDDSFRVNTENTFELNQETTTTDLATNEVLTTLSKPKPLWFREGTLFLSPNQYEPWQDLAWKGIVLQLLMYAGIELCVRIECRGIIARNAPIVNDFIAHIDRMPEAVRISEYVGEKMKTPPVKKLILAFQAQRGKELYGYSTGLKIWNTGIRPNLSSEQETKILVQVEKLKAHVENFFTLQEENITSFTYQPRNILESTSLKRPDSKDILPRYSCFNNFTTAARTYLSPLTEQGAAMDSGVLKERQELFNRLGGEPALMRALEYGESFQNEMRQLPLLSLIKPGTERMRQLPKGMILLGEPGNGRTYFVRTLATASRLPLLITESNRYLNEVNGLVRLKTLFKRAREQAPNILFIRDLDFMTRHRERYPMFGSVRATTQLLLAMDGYSRGTETIASQQDIFVMGSMTTTSMMDDACMRSGRFEWVLDFYYPPVKERHQMLLLHSQKSVINTPIDIDWKYFSAMTEGFSCLDLRILVNTSAVYMMKQGLTNIHTKESMAFALGSINQVHDLPQTRFVDASSTLGFFPTFAFSVRHNQPTQYAPFFTQTGQIPMYKKLMHVFRNMVPDETETLKQRWNTTAQMNSVKLHTTPPISVVDGLLPLLSEGLFIYNAQKTIGTPYPVVTFETYCYPLFFTAKEALDVLTSQHTLERITKEHMFITSFDIWRQTQLPTPYPMGITSVKSIDMRSRATSLLRAQRFSKEHSLIGGLNEVQYEMLFGAPPIADKIKNRLNFLTKKRNEFASRDANIFGTFETNNDLSFKCRKETTARRIDQVAMEIVSLMQKNWR